MFKKTKIAAITAAVLGLSSMTAQAVSINDAGEEGQVLIFPYYNVRSGFVTAFNIVNTKDTYKAVKVRFREGTISSDVIDFNLYLSPNDVFTMQLKQDGDDVVLTTADNSCTQPTIPEDGVKFRPIYMGNDVEDLLEGYLEVIEMGEVDETATVTVGGTTKLIAAGGILHGLTGIPKDCSVLQAAWDQGSFLQGGAESQTGVEDIIHPKAPTSFSAQQYQSEDGYYGKKVAEGLTSPTGGLVGVSILVDTVNITGFVAEPTAIVNYSTVPQHYLSSDESFYLLPSLASGSIKTSEMLTVDGGVAREVENEYSIVNRDWGLDDPDLAKFPGANPEVPSGVNPMPIADAMLVEALSNQYFLGEGTVTDWVISLPMRKHAIYKDFKYHGDSTGFNFSRGDIAVGGVVGDENASAELGYWEKLTSSDVIGTISYYDREEQFPRRATTPDDFSPPTGGPDLESGDVPFTRETNALVFRTSDDNNDSAIGSELGVRYFTLADGFTDGWATLTFNKGAYNLTDPDGRYGDWVTVEKSEMSAKGVPIHGFMAVKSGLGHAAVGETFMHFDSKPREIFED